MGLQSWWTEGGAVQTQMSTKEVRNIWTTAFVVINIATSLLGAYSLKRRNQRRLLNRKGNQFSSISVNALSPWLGLGGLGSYLWHIRRLPGGAYGSFLMLWTGVFSLAHQYFVNSFIVLNIMQGVCQFEEGCISSYEVAPLVPATTWPVTRLVNNAQAAAALTNGAFGIYETINTSNSNFFPRQQDLLGFWNCTQLPVTTMYPENFTSQTNVESWVGSQGLLYDLDSVDWSINDAVYPNGSLGGFAMWASSFKSNSTTYSLWDVKVAIASPLITGYEAPISSFFCTVQRLRDNWTPVSMPSHDTLEDWSSVLFGRIKETNASTWQFAVESILNAMSMIAGTGNQVEITMKTTGVKSGIDPTYGCALEGTEIQLPIFVMLFTLCLLFFTVCIVDFYSFLRYKLDTLHERVHDMPGDYLSWQLLAVRADTGEKTLPLEKLGDQMYSWHEERKEMGFADKSITDSVPLLPVHEAYQGQNVEQSTGGQVQQQYDPPQQYNSRQPYYPQRQYSDDSEKGLTSGAASFH